MPTTGADTARKKSASCLTRYSVPDTGVHSRYGHPLPFTSDLPKSIHKYCILCNIPVYRACNLFALLGDRNGANMTLAMTLGRKLRELRHQKDWSLADLSKRSGVALSSLSRIETGRMTGTLESHIQIAKVLGVRLAELHAGLDPLGGPLLEIRSKEEPGDKLQAGKAATLAPLTGPSLQKKMLAVLLTLAPRQTTRRDRGPDAGEEFLYVLKGKFDLVVGQEKARLNPGDSAYYQTSLPQQLTNPGATTAAQALRVSSPPTL